MPEDLENSDDAQADESPVIRDLRQKANRMDAAEAKADKLERENVVLRAGLNGLTDKQLKALSAAHEGDWEPEALKATATELGFGASQSAEQSDEPKVPADELAAHQRVAAAANGEAPPPPTDLDAALDAAKSAEEVNQLLANAGMLKIE